MAKFFSLVKVQLSQIFSTIFSKNNSKRKKSFYLIFAFFAVLIAFSVGTTFYGNGEMLRESGGNYILILFQAGLIAVLFTLLMLAMEAQSHFFKTRDFEFLQTLPLKPFEIVSAKYLSLLLSGYLYSLIMIIPAVVVYFMFAGFSLSVLLLSIIWLVFFPIIPSLFASIIGLAIAFINSKVKNPQIISILFLLIFLGLYFAYTANYNSILVWLNSQGTDLFSSISIILPSVGLFLQGLTVSFWYTLLYIVVNIIAFVLTIMLVSSLYAKININLNKSKAIAKGELTFTSTSVFNRFLKNESKMYFSNSLWLMNTLVMVIIACLAPVLLYFSADSITASFPSFSIVAILFMIFLITMPSCNTACVSLSLEGKKFGVLKALPVSPNTIMRAKITFNVLLVLPFILVAEILSLLFFGDLFNTFTALMLFVLPLVAVIGSSIFGMSINLLFPKTDFYSYAQVVKQSASSGIGMIGSIFVNLIPFIIFLSSPFDFSLFLILLLIYNILWAGAWLLFLKFKGTKLFNRIS